jgi:hypothetical protein
MTTKRKTTTKKQTRAKPKVKVVYRTRTKKVYIREKDENPMSGVNDTLQTGVGALMTVGVASAVLKGLNNI